MSVTPLGLTALVLLVFQNCGATLLLRYVRTRPDVDVPTASIGCVVLLQEATKLVASLLWCCYDSAALVASHPEQHGPLAAHRSHRRSHGALRALGHVAPVVMDQLRYTGKWRLALPALLFSLQNTVLFVAMTHLHATAFMVLYQSKVLLTACLMVVVLKRTFSIRKWTSLVVLVGGIVLTQVSGGAGTAAAPPTVLDSSDGSGMLNGSATPIQMEESASASVALGVGAVLVAASSSAVGSVGMEWLLKTSDTAFLSTKNVFLSCFSLIMVGIPTIWSLDADQRTISGCLRGVDSVVWLMILNQALGGILVALTLTYADNMLKGFATTIAIVVGGFGSYVLFGNIPSLTFVSGAVVVCAAVAVYNLPDKQP